VPFRHLVVDANAIITGSTLAGLADRYWTTAEVLAEVRDRRARELLAALPIKLETRLPSEASVEAVRAFAAKTGDLRALSRTDVMLLALTHQLEREANGGTYLRAAPPAAVTTGGLISQPRVMPECRFYHTEAGCRNGADCRFKHTGEPGSPMPGALPAAEPPADVAGAVSATPMPGGTSVVTATGLPAAGQAATSSSRPRGDSVATAATGSGSLAAAAALHVAGKELAAPSIGTIVEDEDGDGNWVCPLPPGAADAAAAAVDPDTPQRAMVAIITADFAMQNTALQLGLNLATVGGKLVRSVRQWVLKCDACFAIFPSAAGSVADSLFCRNCGNATLARLGVTLGADGQPRYHYKQDRVVNTRGTIFSLPAPHGGRSADLLMRGDQLLTGQWQQIAKRKARDDREGLTSDRTVDDRGEDPRARFTKRSAAEQGIFVGLGGRNPNASRGRRR
jgi:RNA-binding protein NOB1